MTSSLAKRVGRIISGSLHAIVDALEGSTPEIVMEQAIREVMEALGEVRNELGKTIASKHLATKRLAQKNAEHEEFSSQIQVAVEKDRDDLAEAAIARQMDIEAQIPVLEQTIVDCVEKEEELEGFIQALQAKRREMEDELDNYRKMSQTLTQTTVDSDGNVRPGSDIQHKVDAASSSFDRILKRQTGLPSRDASSPKDAAYLLELEKLARKNRIQERLAAYKSGNAE